MFWSDWLIILGIGIVVVISPGPDFALTIRNSLAYSRQAGIYTSLGIFVGNSIHTSYSLIGIGAIIAHSVVLFNLFKWLGAAYLIYIGIKSLAAKPQRAIATNRLPQRPIQRWTAFRIGLLGNLLNPKATLFSLALFTQIIRPGTPIAIQALYGMTIATLSLLWFTLVAIFISQRSIKALLHSVSHWLERITGAVLVILGLRLATVMKD